LREVVARARAFIHMPATEDRAGPTQERLGHAGEFFTVAGRSKSSRKITMLDDALGRAWVRRKISPEEYSALRRYALHWLAGGLQGHLGSVDLNRIYAFDPARMTGLASSEAQCDHRMAYYSARESLGTRPAYVADQVACLDVRLSQVGYALGYRSIWRGRAKAAEILSDAGYRLVKFWESLHR
jgi:hypothetical protein